MTETILRKKSGEESKKSTETLKEEVKMDNNMIINDVTPETKAKLAKTVKKSTKKPKTTTKKVKGGEIMDHKAQLIQVLEKAAKKHDLSISRLTNRAGEVSSVRLQKGNDNVATVRSTDVVIHSPEDMFAKKVLNSSPVFKLFNKEGVQTYTHMTHLRLKVSVENLTNLVAKACGDKSSTSQWKAKLGAVGRSTSAKSVDPAKRLKMLQEKEKALKAEIAEAKKAKVKVVKKATNKKVTKAIKSAKSKGAIARVAKATI